MPVYNESKRLETRRSKSEDGKIDVYVNRTRDMAGPPGFEPGTLPQGRERSRAFRVASQRFVIPEGKSIIDTVSVTDALPFQDPNLMDLTELRALTVTTQTSVKRILQNKSREIMCADLLLRCFLQGDFDSASVRVASYG